MNWLRIVSYVALAVLVVPVFLLLYEGLGPLRNPLGYSYVVLDSIALSLMASALATIVCVLLFTPLGYYFARTKNKVGETLADLPATIPHPIVGVAILILASPLTPFGRFLISIGLNLFDSILGMVVALTLVSAPIYIKSIEPFFQSLNRSYEHFALGLGASRFRTFVSVVVPLSRRGVLSASLISMSRAMSEFGSLAILVYYIRGAATPFNGVSPASVLIFQYYSYYGLPAAVSASSAMILVAIGLNIALRFANR